MMMMTREIFTTGRPWVGGEDEQITSRPKHYRLPRYNEQPAADHTPVTAKYYVQ